MHTALSLLDLHARTQYCLQGVLAHARGADAGLIHRTLEALGPGTIAERIQHVIGAERYWVGVVHGEILTDEDDADRVSVDALEAFRARVAARTRAWLEATDDATLAAAALFTTYGGHEVTFAPAYVVLRTQTHAFQHMGQVTAMYRAFGRPIPPGLDFPMRDFPPPGATSCA